MGDGRGDRRSCRRPGPCARAAGRSRTAGAPAFDPRPGLRAHRQEGETGGQRQRLLAPHHDHVDAPGLGLERHRTRSRDRIHHEQRPGRSRVRRGRKRLHVVTDAGGRLRELDEHRPEARIAIEGGRDGFAATPLRPRAPRGPYVHPVRLADVGPPLAEAGPRRSASMRVAGGEGVDDRRPPSPPSPSSESISASCDGLQKTLESGAAFAEEAPELLAAVVRDVARESASCTRGRAASVPA